jgi:hypothetical protein
MPAAATARLQAKITASANEEERQMTTKPKRNVKCCTAEQAAAIDFEPWQEDRAFKAPTLEEIRNPHLIRYRLAYGMMYKTKPDLVELFSDAEVGGDLEESRKFFEGAAKLIEAARLRLIIAGSSFTEAA